MCFRRASAGTLNSGAPKKLSAWCQLGRTQAWGIGPDKCFQEMEGGNDLANGAESFHFALWRPDGGGVGPAGTIAGRAYAPKPGAPARPAIVREACQQLAGERRTTGEALLTQNRKHYHEDRSRKQSGPQPHAFAYRPS